MPTLWKSFKTGLKNEYGDIHWKFNEWVHQKGKIEACKNGLHASSKVINAIQFINCEIIAQVEVKGKSDLSEDDKQAWSDMRIIKTYKWEKTDSVKLAIFAAELVLNFFEKKYPKDDRPRKAIEAIEAAKDWLNNPTEENRLAAEAAAEAVWAARAVWAAVRAADAVVWAAEAADAVAWAAAWAAEAARAATRAAEAAEAVAWAAEAVVWAAWAARAATRAARAATRAAEAAEAVAWAAEAARAATRAAEAVVWAAWAARASGADSILNKCEDYIQKEIIPNLKEYEF